MSLNRRMRLARMRRVKTYFRHVIRRMRYRKLSNLNRAIGRGYTVEPKHWWEFHSRRLVALFNGEGGV